MQTGTPEQRRQCASEYAAALASLGRATGQLDRIERELPEVGDLFEKHEQLRCFLARNDVQLEGKLRAVEALLADQLAPALVYTLLAMLQSGDIALLDEFQRAFDRGVSDSRERVTGEVESAVPLSAERVAQLEREVGRVIGKKVRLHPRVSRSILGGLLVRVGDVVIDGTVDSQLTAMQEQLLAR